MSHRRRPPYRSIWAPMVLLLAAVSAGPAEPTEPRCSLAWSEVLENFGPDSGWKLTEPPIAFSLSDAASPQYQAHLFASGGDIQSALIIAEWGDPGSAALGPIVYCTIHDARGAAVEELGTNPLTARATSWPCDQCA